MASVSLQDMIGSRKSALTVAEVAEMLNVSKRLVYQLVSAGEIPHFKVGSAVRFEPKAKSVNSCYRNSAPQFNQPDVDASGANSSSFLRIVSGKFTCTVGIAARMIFAAADQPQFFDWQALRIVST